MLPIVAPPQEIKKPVLLLGEGIEEVVFFNAILKYMSIDNVQVESYGGKPKLAGVISTMRVRTGFNELRSLGITRDADLDPAGAFDSIQNNLIRNRFSSPRAPGNIIDGTPRVGVWIFPDCIRPGMLEDFCLMALQGEPEMLCIQSFFECISQTTGRVSSHPSKAKVRAWLATQSNPEYRLGEAAEAGIWPLGCDSFDAFRTFISNLLPLP